MDKILLIIISFLLVFSRVSLAQTSMDYGKELGAYLDYIEEYEGFSGNVLVVKGGQIVLRESYGYGNREEKIPLAVEDRMPIGSLSKQFVALAILGLEEEGKLSLEEKISKYFPDYSQAGSISIEDLLLHSSGIRDFVDYRQFMKLRLEDLDQENIMKEIYRGDLAFEPGQGFLYSNSNYFLLSLIIEEVTGRELGDYLEEKIFRPLGMKDTGLIGRGNFLRTRVQPYSPGPGVDMELENQVLARVKGAGNIYSSLDDLYKWDRALYSDRLLTRENMARWFEARQAINHNTSSAYGFRVNRARYGRRLYHTGSTLGFTANISRYIDYDTSIILLSNLGQYNIGRFRDNIEKIIFDGRSFRPEPVDFDRKFLGRYSYKYGLKLNVYQKEGDFYASLLNFRPLRLFPVSGQSLRSVHSNIEFNFKDQAGEARILEIRPYNIRARFWK